MMMKVNLFPFIRALFEETIFFGRVHAVYIEKIISY